MNAATTDAAIVQELDQILHERHQALLTLDLEYARRNIPGLSSDEACLGAMHKARYEITEMPRELRHESRAWLEAHGFTRYRQQPWPPIGELPE